jgi:hypothetical protein
MLWHSPQIATKDFEKESGWTFKPEGACKGDVCIPLSNPPGDELDLADISASLGLPMVASETHNLYAIGPEAIGSRALTTAEAPHLVLPDLEGKPFDLASLRGKKVVVYAWAPY